jgi:hypothetical protein
MRRKSDAGQGPAGLENFLFSAPLTQDRDNAFSRFSIPELRLSGFSFHPELPSGMAENRLRANSGQHIVASLKRNRSFRIFSKRHTGNPQNHRFLLNAPGIGEDHT